MVRKWSYIGYKTFKIKNKDVFYRIKRKFIYKVFRSTTRFRKCYFKFWSKFLRKGYRRRKHKTNWLLFFNLLYEWVKFYLKSKQHIRYYQSVGLFFKQLYSTSFILFKKQSLFMYETDGFNFYSCSKKILKYFKLNYSSRSELVQMDHNFIKDVPYVGFQIYEDADVNKYELVNPGLYYYDHLYFSITDFHTTISTTMKLEIYDRFKTTFIFLQLQYCVLVYSITILLALKWILN